MCECWLLFMTTWIAICSFPFGNRCHKWKHECSLVQRAKTHTHTHFVSRVAWFDVPKRKINASLSSLTTIEIQSRRDYLSSLCIETKCNFHVACAYALALRHFDLPRTNWCANANTNLVIRGWHIVIARIFSVPFFFFLSFMVALL